MSYIDLDETGPKKGNLWIYRVVKHVSGGTWLVGKNARTKCHKAGEAAAILWDAVLSMNFLAGTIIKKFDPSLCGTRTRWKLGVWTLASLLMACSELFIVWQLSTKCVFENVCAYFMFLFT